MLGERFACVTHFHTWSGTKMAWPWLAYNSIGQTQVLHQTFNPRNWTLLTQVLLFDVDIYRWHSKLAFIIDIQCWHSMSTFKIEIQHWHSILAFNIGTQHQHSTLAFNIDPTKSQAGRQVVRSIFCDCAPRHCGMGILSSCLCLRV